MIELIYRSYMPDLWRCSKYRRQDGSTFSIAVPSVRIAEGPREGERFYCERTEARMLLRLANKK